MATKSIQRAWWTNAGIHSHVLSDEPDQPWNWLELAQHIATTRENERIQFAVAVVTACLFRKTIEVQGAMACDFQATSLLEPLQPALYLQWLASNPRNRRRLMGDSAVYRGVGEQLVITSMMESRYAGFGGRVLLRPLPGTEEFYEKLKFQPAVDGFAGRMYYEITSGDAEAILRREGWI
jgi:hypothetical protein